MMLWLGVVLLLSGLPLLAVDRRFAMYVRENLSARTVRLIARTTDWAKGMAWIIGACVVYLGAQAWMSFEGETPSTRMASNLSLSLLASLVAGSIILHTVKIFLGRRRPRDDFEHGLYGFVFFTWTLQHNSFPSGHSLTIFCVAVWASAVLPVLAPFWLAVALYLSLTRALLAVHFLSDVAVGAGIGIIATRETLVLLFPQLPPPWF